MNRSSFFPFCLSAFMLVVVGCSNLPEAATIDLEHYEPVGKFVPAYEALTNRTDLATNKDYDIEQTVRVLNALEIAQANSKNFNEFLEYMAKQDYTGVAPDVLEAKQKLLPILQYMYKLQGQDEQLNDLWMLARSAAKGAASADDPFRLAGAVVGNPLAILDIMRSDDASKATDAAFEQYEKDKELKANMKRDIEKLRGSYLQYLTDYAPIYHKYMKEYDALCVQKDKAYLDLYGGRVNDALGHTRQILSKYPHNSEAMLLQSMALIMKAPAGAVIASTDSVATIDSIATIENTSTITPMRIVPQSTMAEASATLDYYMQEFPGKTAPALLLKGLMEQKMGHEQAAMSYFDQASIEYPRQAAQLTDMLDSYRTRTYLNKTPEGQYLQRLYSSTMEGYGMFSPNLLKAKHYADQGKTDEARQEIFNHFFRRGNQGIYSALLSDMQFCEEHLYGPFKQLLIEHSYIDVDVEPESEWLFWKSDDLLNVKINNRSDMDLENVRVFLCIHYTDMYKDEYDVVKVPRTMNVIPKHSTADLDTLRITYPGKKYDDITRIRAIAVTDDRICWVDDVDYKQSHVLDFLRGGRSQSEQLQQAREEYLSNYSLDPAKLRQTLMEGVTVLPPEENPAEEKNWWETFCGWFTFPDNDLKIELPRVLTMLDPVFSLRAIDGEDALAPKENYLSGTAIHLVFDYVPQYEEKLPLYIYSDFVSFRVNILYKGKDSVVEQVEVLK
jgi:tetratricopeptide (TPR) repeat protein